MPDSMMKKLTLTLGVKGSEKVESALGGIRSRLMSVIGAAKIAIGVLGAMAAAAGGALVKSVISASVEMDSLMRGLRAVTGSADAATAELAKLKEVAKLPGLGFQEAIQGSVRLQAAGLSAELSRESLMSFGNALATVGKGRAELDGVILALTQITAKGKVMAQEINQIAERVPQVRVAMQAAFGTANTELLQKQGMTAKEFIQGLVDELGKLEKVTGGAANAQENLGDTWFQIKVLMGDKVLPTFVGVLSSLEAVLRNNIGSFEKLGMVMNTAFQFVVGLVTIIKNLIVNNWETIKTFGLIAGAITALAVTIGLLTNPIVQIGLLVFAAIEIWKRWGTEIETFVADVIEVIRPFLNRLLQWWAFQAEVVRIVFTAIYDAIRDNFDKIVDFAKPVFDFLSEAWAFIGRQVNRVAGVIGDIWSKTQDKLAEQQGEGSSRIAGIMEEIGEAWERITNTDMVAATGDFISKSINKIDDGLGVMKKKFLEIATVGAMAVAPAADGGPLAAPTAPRIPEIPVPSNEVFDALEAINIPLMDVIASMDTIAEKIEVMGEEFQKHGEIAKAAFQGGVGAANSYYHAIEAQSRAFFRGEHDRLFTFSSVADAVWRGFAAGAIQSIADVLKAQARAWALEGAKAIADGLWPPNPAAIAKGTRLLALAALAGGAAATIGGAAVAIQESGAERLRERLAPEEEEETAGGRRGRGAATRTGTTLTNQAQTVNFNPTVAFQVSDGGMIFLGGISNIEEAAGALKDLLIKLTNQSIENNEITL